MCGTTGGWIIAAAGSPVLYTLFHVRIQLDPPLKIRGCKLKCLRVLVLRFVEEVCPMVSCIIEEAIFLYIIIKCLSSGSSDHIHSQWAVSGVFEWQIKDINIS